MKAAFKRAMKQTSDFDEMVKMVREEVGEDTFQQFGKEVAERIICGGVCIGIIGVSAIAGLSWGAWGR